MNIALYIIAILWIILATFLIIYTERTREFLERVFLTDKIRMWASLPIIVGLLFIIGAFFNRDMFWLAFIIGLLATSKGVYFLIAPPKQIRGLLEWWFVKAGPGTVRLFGLIAFVLGVAVLSYLRY